MRKSRQLSEKTFVWQTATEDAVFNLTPTEDSIKDTVRIATEGKTVHLDLQEAPVVTNIGCPQPQHEPVRVQN